MKVDTQCDCLDMIDTQCDCLDYCPNTFIVGKPRIPYGPPTEEWSSILTAPTFKIPCKEKKHIGTQTESIGLYNIFTADIAS